MITGQLIFPLILVVFFSLLGFIATQAGDAVDCNLNENEYLKSRFYNETNFSYQEGVKQCKQSQDILYWTGALSPIIGIATGTLHYIINRETHQIKSGKEKKE